MQGFETAGSFPFFDALVQRRARRFPAGATLPGGFNAHSSSRPARPLDDVEEALVVMSATGLTGHVTADLQYADQEGRSTSGNTMLSFSGRTYPSACAAHGTSLLVTNDDMTYLVDLTAVEGAREELDHSSAVDLLVSQWQHGKSPISTGRLDIPLVTPLVSPLNHWDMNVPGSTLLMPVTDVTLEYLNLVVTFLDEPRNVYLYDDLTGQEPLKHLAESGHLDRSRPMSLTQFEHAAGVYTTGAEQAVIAQNVMLALQTIGLGGWIMGAANGRLVMGALELSPGLGMTCVDAPGPSLPWMANPGEPIRIPVGLDHRLRALVPPNVADMHAAVREVHERKWGSEGLFRSENNPYGRRLDTAGVPEPQPWVVEAAGTWAQHILDTHGRFPATMDPLQMGVFVQAHHLDIDWYQRFENSVPLPRSILDHDRHWHS